MKTQKEGTKEERSTQVCLVGCVGAQTFLFLENKILRNQSIKQSMKNTALMKRKKKRDMEIKQQRI